ncbi:MAG TPA: hypothetical protein PLA43_19625 [Bryobacteraceae bacterium]|nr:hypothetical protein [Bryobacteraceae bacterium]HOL70170.1 hypothetical protein [Bryobacteraceae bacterium]HOQ45488.1 hypothetical protein [Bryobacteraceae bacterium]HPQ16663.1 hypothetical protein [Bryobacteraceae bacterium]HPU74170.1 hypothetical protein [Bryobacteraceae bacterium]
MSLNLDELKTEVLRHLEKEGFVVFHGYSRLADTDSFVAWDTERHPSYQKFLEAAKKAGVALIVYHHREFTQAHVDEAAERLEGCDFSVEEQRAMERKLRELREYEGFTCALELSFDLNGRVYLFNLRAEWYEDYLDLLEEMDAAMTDEEDDDEPMGGYYSRN